MKNKITRMLRAASFASAFVVACSGAQALTLPAVTNCGYGGSLSNLLCYEPSPGVKIYVASQHDEFISYSVNALQTLTNSFGYTGLSEWSKMPSFGSGQIVKLFTFNESSNTPFPESTDGTGDNQAPAPDGDQTLKNDGLYFGEWPVGSVVTVGDLQEFLGKSLFTPIFNFDLNNGGDLLLNGQLQVRTAGGATVDTFAFDNVFNGAYDQSSFVAAQDTVTVQWTDFANTSKGCNPITGLCTMEVDNNTGSGKPDFFAYAPTFDLRDFAPTDRLYFALRMSGLDGGGEELALTNLLTPPGTNVPEPGVLVLLAIGLAGVSAARRMKKFA